MESSAAHDSKHKMAAYPPNLVHGNDGGGRERLEKLQNHFERLVPFGFQHHHDGLKGENHPPRFLLKYRGISRCLQIKDCMYETIPPKPFPVRPVCVSVRCWFYLIDKLVIEMWNLQVSETPFSLCSISRQHVLLQ